MDKQCRTPWYRFLGGGGVALLIGLMTGCGQPAQNGAPPTQVEQQQWVTVVAQEETLPLLRTVVGHLEAEDEVHLASRITGRVVKMAVQAGQRVQAGSLIAEVDAQDVVAGQQQAQAGVSVAEAGLRQAQAALAEVQARQAAVQAALVDAQRHRDRMANLHQEGAVSQAMLDQAQTRLSVVQADYGQVQAALIQAERGIEQAQAQIRQAQAGVSQAQAQLTYARIVAPFAGVITQTFVEVGSLVGPGQPLAHLESSDRLRFQMQVPESVLPFLRLGQTLSVQLDQRPQPVLGQISQIIPSASVSSRTSTVKLSLPPIPDGIPGLMGRIQVETRQPLATVVIPISSVVERLGITGVYRLHQGDPLFTPVVLGSRSGDRVQVHGGIQSGDILIQDGDQVNVF